MIEITRNLVESDRTRAGQIYYEAFRRKLQPLLGKPEATLRLLSDDFNLNMAIGIKLDGELLGLADLHSRESIFSRVGLRNSCKDPGLLAGFYASVVLNLFGAGANYPTDELRIAALAT